MEPEASERLFSASAAMETEPVRVPTMPLHSDSSRLQAMPTRPDMVPIAERTRLLEMFS